MYNNISEQKAANRRRSALVLAIFLHLAFAAALYFGSTEHTNSKDIVSPNNQEETQPSPQAKVANLP